MELFGQTCSSCGAVSHRSAARCVGCGKTLDRPLIHGGLAVALAVLVIGIALALCWNSITSITWTSAQHSAAEKTRERARLTKAREAARTAVARELQDSLNSLGYSLMVKLAEKPEEIIIIAPEFNDADHRVRFLSLLRSRNSPAAGVCSAGFRTARLNSSEWAWGFSQQYSLDCAPSLRSY